MIDRPTIDRPTDQTTTHRHLGVIIQGDILLFKWSVIVHSHLFLERMLPLFVYLNLSEELVSMQLFGDEFVLLLVVKVVVSRRENLAKQSIGTEQLVVYLGFF